MGFQDRHTVFDEPADVQFNGFVHPLLRLLPGFPDRLDINSGG